MHFKKTLALLGTVSYFKSLLINFKWLLTKTNRPEICSFFSLPLYPESLKIIQEAKTSYLPQSLPLFLIKLIQQKWIYKVI